jgi:uncharacterized delta-60 repeat protein
MRRLRNKFFVPGWRGVIGLGVLALAALGAGTALAQPANDNFANATDLSFFGAAGTYFDINTGATRETGEPFITGDPGGSSVWYAWTAPSNGVVSLDTIGSDFDTLLGVYVGNNVSNLTLVAEDNDSGGGGTSALTFNAPAGTTFYFAVDGVAGAQGDITLNWTMNAATLAPTNDNYETPAILATDSGTIFDNNELATAELFELFGFGQFGTNSVWYEWTAPDDGVVTFDTHGSTFDTLLDVYEGTNQPQAFFRSENDDFIERRSSQVSLVVSAGETYLISVNGYNPGFTFGFGFQQVNPAESGFIRLDWNFTSFPANDDFENAETLDNTSLWGSITENNTGASAEFGEPNHAGFAASQSLWYKWTAPQDGEVQMDTIGSSFDTVLAVYTGASLSGLSQVAANDDMFPTFPTPGAGQTPQVNEFGQNYDSTNIPPWPGVLTISPTNLVNPTFNYGFNPFTEFDQPYTGLPGVSVNGSGASGLRFNAKAGTTYYFAVDGKQGSSGQFNLNWAYHSSGAFRFASENQDMTAGIPSKSGGFFFTGTGGEPGMLLYEVAETEEAGYRQGRVNAAQFDTTFNTDYAFGQYNHGLLVTITRVGGYSGRVTVGYSTVAGANISDHYSFDPINDVLVPDGVPLSLHGDAPAQEFTDFTPISGTLTFDDFEMSKTILIPIVDDFGIYQPNRDFSVVIYNPQKDLLESTDVSQPRLDPVFSQALVRILDADIDPRGPAEKDIAVTNIVTDPITMLMTTNYFTNQTFSLQSTNAIFNFLKSNYRIPEDVSDYWGNTPITVYVGRTGTNTAAATISYRINSHFLDDGDNEVNHLFPLEPGSDYATPPGAGNVFTTGAMYNRPPVDFTPTAPNGTLTFPAKKVDPQPITFTVNNDTMPEFNEDFQIDIYDLDQNGNPIQVGMIPQTTVTIMFDDNDPPAGSVDEYYNPDFSLDIVPPVNGAPIGTQPLDHPGTDAQSQVNAVVVQPADNKSIIGGDFSSYNGASRHGIARINIDGQLDTTFDPGDGVSVATGDFISALALQPDGKVIVAGSFSSFNGHACGNIARLNADGSLDTAFLNKAGAGASGTVRSLVLRGDGTIILGGDFTSYNGIVRNYVARLNADGSLDTTYNPGTALNHSVYALGPAAGTTINVSATAAGTDLEYTNIVNVGAPSGVLTVSYDMLAIPDDMRVYYGNTNTAAGTGVLIFDTGLVSGTNTVVIPFGPTNGLTANTIEIVMNQGNGTPGTFWDFTASVQTFAGDQLIVGGDFTSAGGVPGQDHIARLLGDGSLDATFDPSSGANGRVRAIVVQSSGAAVVGGDFTLMNGQTASHIVRLNANGSTDTGFFCGTGTDGGVYHLNYIPQTLSTNQTVQGTNIVTTVTTNLETIYVGGPFTEYNGTHRLGFARLNIDGSLDTSFLDTAYNQFAGLPRHYYNDRPNAVFASAVQSDGNVMIGGSFSQVGGGQFDVNVRPESLDPNEYKEPKVRTGIRNRNNVARLIGGSTAGPGNIGLLNANYPTTKSAGFLYALLTRTNGSLGNATANFSIGTGTAQSGILGDYTYNASPPLYGELWEYVGPTRMHSDAFWGTNTVMNDDFGHVWSLGLNGMSSVIISINNNQFSSGDVNAQVQLANPPSADWFFLGGENIPLGVGLARSVAPFNIVDDGKKPGTFGFSSPSYSGSTTATITVTRTNGFNNTSPILIDYSTVAGPSTANGVDYFDTSGTLTFNDGDTIKAFPVQIISSNYISSVEKTVNLQLRNIRGASGAILGQSNAVLRIINPNFQGYLNLSSASYVTNQSAGAIQFMVTRTVGNKGTLDVAYSTADGSALAGTDYVKTTNTLHWNSGDSSPRTVSVPLLNRGDIGVNRSLSVSIMNAASNGVPAPLVLGSTTTASLSIINDNNYGVFQFSAPTYVVNEATNGVATITVLRTGSVMSNAVINFTTADGTATAGANYVATNGALSFAPGQSSVTFGVRILEDGVVDPQPFYFNVLLTNATTGAVLGSPTNAQVNIVDAESFNRPPGDGDVTFNQQGINADVLALALQSDGKIVAGGNFTAVNGIPRNHFARFNGDGSLDTGFLNSLAGADGAIHAVAVQTDGRVLLGGSFGQINSVVRNRIGRVNTDGTLDTSFSPGAGADNSIFAMAETFIGGAREIYVGGAFTLFRGVTIPGIVRVNDNGTVDSTFASTGVNGTVYAVAVYPANSVYTGKVLIGGSFTTVNGINWTNIARLNADGSLDTNFVVGTDGAVRAIAIQNDNAALIGGEFGAVNGVSMSRLARLNTGGTVDAAFISNATPGPTGFVNTIAVQADNRIVVGGQFLKANGVTRHRITRLLPSGAADPTINFGDGANGDVDVAVIQPADQMILIGGGFTQYNDQSAPYLTRIYGGSETGSGAFEFTSASYQVNENGIEANITVRRTGGTSGPNVDGTGNVTVQFATSPGSAAPNVNYTTVVTNVSFAPGEVLETVFVPVIDDQVITTNKTVNLALSSPSAGTGLGDQTNAVLTIVNTDNAISFSSDSFQVARNTPTGLATISIARLGGTSGLSTVDFATTTNGTAVIGTDYVPTNMTVTFNPGDTLRTVQIAITNNGLPEGDRTVTMTLSNVVGTTLVSPTNATLTIKDTVFAPGQLYFASTNFFANEGDGTATITVLRTNGSSGTVSAFYYTVPGTAVPGVNYITVSNSLSFQDGQTNRTFTVPLVDNNIAQGPVSLTLVLATNFSSGTTLAYPSNALLTIADNDSGFAFTTATNTLLETAGTVAVGVTRIGPTNSTLSVNYATANGTALAGVNYTTTTGTLTFSPGQVLKSILVPIIYDPAATGDLQFTLAMSNPSTGAQLAYPSTNTIVLKDADAGLSFTNSSLVVRRNVGNAVITVVCSNPSVEPIILNSNTVPLEVQYATSNQTATAGVDYIATTGTLVFTNGIATNTFTVPILNNAAITGDRTFSVRLFNPTSPGRLVAPSNETVTIIDATAGFRFSKSAYSANKTDGSALINVYRTGLTDSVASVDFSATNGSAIANVHYYPTNGTLIFTNGVTNQTFAVQVIDTTVVQPNETVLLQLFNPTNSVLTAPNAATLTIKDNTGSFVVPAGAVLTSESGAGAPNGVVDSNETVTVQFAFRDAGGLNVNNLIATLLATNGVSSPSPSSQPYGQLLSGRHSVSQPFSFTAHGTNGQQITATFQLMDGATNIGSGVFGFTLGESTMNFTNPATVVINDNAIASPYPSTIGISNMPGTVLKATITLTNLAHGSPHDIDALLVSPPQQTALFMAHAGGTIAISNVTVTFDDAASTVLPQSGQIMSGTNKPSVYAPVPVFP